VKDDEREGDEETGAQVDEVEPEPRDESRDRQPVKP